MKKTIIDLLEGNSTKTWRRTVCLFILFLLFLTSTFGTLGAWLTKEVYSFPREYLTTEQFEKHNKSVDVRLADYKKSVDSLLMFLLDKHYPDASKVYDKLNKEGNDDPYIRDNPAGNK